MLVASSLKLDLKPNEVDFQLTNAVESQALFFGHRQAMNSSKTLLLELSYSTSDEYEQL
jgi:hypothetical protein